MVSVVQNKKEYINICLFLQGKDDEVILSKHVKHRLKKKASFFILINNDLFIKDEGNLHKRVLHGEDIDLMKLETKKIHNLQHYGVNRFEEICNQFFFKIPRDIIREVVSNCTTCAQAQPLKTKETQVHIVAQRPMERLMIDLVDMQRYKSCNKENAWILTIIDVYSKFAWAFPMFKKTGVEVSKNLEELFYRNTGPPMILQSDNGKEFINKDMTDLCKRFLIVFKHSRPRHPQANGQIERFNQTLSRYLQKYIFEEENSETQGEKTWLKHLDKVLYNYNLAKHASTKNTPFRLRLQIPGFNTVCIDPNDESQIENNSDFKNLGAEDDLKEKEVANECLETEEKIWEPSVCQNYLNRMDRNSLVHLSKYTIEIGDKVLISKDFDKNIKTKKLKLSSFFSNISVVRELLSNDRIKVRNYEGKDEIIHLSRVKKVKKDE